MVHRVTAANRSGKTRAATPDNSIFHHRYGVFSDEIAVLETRPVRIKPILCGYQRELVKMVCQVEIEEVM